VVQPRSLGSRPLTAAATSLAAGRGAASPGAAAVERPDPAVLLAGMMDLRGSVELAQKLALLERGPGARGGGDPPRSPQVNEALARLSASIDRTFADPFQRRNKLPSPEQVHEALAQTGALASRSGRPLSAASARIWEPIGELITTAVERVRFEAQAIRDDLATLLRAGGPRLARLERLDAALLGATARGRARLVAELLIGLEHAFARGLTKAVKALPDPSTPAHLAAWFAEGGLILGAIERGRGVVTAVLAHERSRLSALSEAASEPLPRALSGSSPP
jgi:hypothetical protein